MGFIILLHIDYNIINSNDKCYLTNYFYFYEQNIYFNSMEQSMQIKTIVIIY